MTRCLVIYLFPVSAGRQDPQRVVVAAKVEGDWEGEEVKGRGEVAVMVAKGAVVGREPSIRADLAGVAVTVAAAVVTVGVTAGVPPHVL
jgi:hypothetical protein